jgi:hypothetical protein
VVLPKFVDRGGEGWRLVFQPAARAQKGDDRKRKIEDRKSTGGERAFVVRNKKNHGRRYRDQCHQSAQDRGANPDQDADGLILLFPQFEREKFDSILDRADSIGRQPAGRGGPARIVVAVSH